MPWPAVASLGQLSHLGQEELGQAKSPHFSFGQPSAPRGPALSLPPLLKEGVLKTQAGRALASSATRASAAGLGASAQRAQGDTEAPAPLLT